MILIDSRCSALEDEGVREVLLHEIEVDPIFETAIGRS